MRAVVFAGARSVAVEDVADAVIEEPGDVVAGSIRGCTVRSIGVPTVSSRPFRGRDAHS
jgi:hypothetical protein